MTVVFVGGVALKKAPSGRMIGYGFDMVTSDNGAPTHLNYPSKDEAKSARQALLSAGNVHAVGSQTLLAGIAAAIQQALQKKPRTGVDERRQSAQD